MALGSLNLGSAHGRIVIDSNGVTLGVNRAMGSFDNLGASAVAMGFLIRDAIHVAVDAVGALADATVGAAADMEAKVSGIAAVLNKQVDEIKPLQDLIMELAIDPRLKVGATEAADAIEMLARGGIDMTEIVDGAALATVLLANATGGSFPVAARTMVDAMSIFNLEAKDAIEIVDTITSVINNSKFNLKDYGFALANAGGVANLLGVSLEELNTMLAITAPTFRSGRDAGTSLKSMLLALLGPTKQQAEAARNLGIQFFDAEGNMRSMQDIFTDLNSIANGTAQVMVEVGGRTAEQERILQKLRDAYRGAAEDLEDYELGIKGAGLSEERRQARMDELIGIMKNAEEQMKPLLAVQGEFVESTREFTQEEFGADLEKIFGSAGIRSATQLLELTTEEWEALKAEMAETDSIRNAETRMNNLSGSVEILTDLLAAYGLELGNLLLGPLKGFVDMLISLAEDQGPAFLKSFGAVFDNIGKVVTSIGNFGTRARVGIPLIDNLAFFVGELAVRFGMTEENVTPLIAKVKDLLTNIREIIEPIQTFLSQNVQLSDAIIGLGLALGVILLPFLGAVLGFLAPLIGWFLIMTAVVAALRQAWETNFGGIREATSGVFDALLIAFEGFSKLMQGDWEGFVESMRLAWETGWGAIRTFLENVWTTHLAPALLSMLVQFAIWWDGLDWSGTGASMVQGIIDDAVAALEEKRQQFAMFANAIIQWANEHDWHLTAQTVTRQLLLKMAEVVGSITGFMAALLMAIIAWAIEADWGEVALTIGTLLVNALISVFVPGGMLLTWLAWILSVLGVDVKSIAWSTIGDGIIDGIIAGINASAGRLANAALRAAVAAFNAMASALGMPTLPMPAAFVPQKDAQQAGTGQKRMTSTSRPGAGALGQNATPPQTGIIPVPPVLPLPGPIGSGSGGRPGPNVFFSPDLIGRSLGGDRGAASPQVNNVVNIDARNADNPAAVAAAVNRALRQSGIKATLVSRTA